MQHKLPDKADKANNLDKFQDFSKDDRHSRQCKQMPTIFLRFLGFARGPGTTPAFYFKARSMADLEGFLEENSALGPGGKKQLLEIYRAATAKPPSFLTVDLLTKDPNKVFLKRFESYLQAM